MAFNWVNRKQLNILEIFWKTWNFILLLTEDDSALKVASQIMLRVLVTYKSIAYKQKQNLQEHN